MRRAIGAFVGCIYVTITLMGCEASCSYSTATLTEAQIAKAIDPTTHAPTEPARSFPPDAAAIYATARLSHTPSATKIKATFHYLEEGEREIAADQIEAEGDRYVSFTLSPPTNGWPPGQYEARLYLNDKEAGRLPFNVTPKAGKARRTTSSARSAPAPRPAPPPAPDPVQASPAPTPARAVADMKRFRDDRFGVEFEVPASWSYRVTEGKAYLIEGPKGTDAYELSVVLQFISKAANPGSSAQAQAQEALAQISQAPEAEIRTRRKLVIDGQEAPYFVATYRARDSRNVSTTFGQTQIVVDHGSYYYWLSYSGPAETYEQHASVFEHVVDTFRFTDRD